MTVERRIRRFEVAVQLAPQELTAPPIERVTRVARVDGSTLEFWAVVRPVEGQRLQLLRVVPTGNVVPPGWQVMGTAPMPVGADRHLLMANPDSVSVGWAEAREKRREERRRAARKPVR